MIDGNLSLGDFTAFYTYLVMLAGPMRMLGVAMGMAQRAIASGNRLFEILDREPRIESPPGAPALPAGGGRVELRDVTLRYDGLPGGAPTATTLSGSKADALSGSTRGRGRDARSRWSGPRASGKTSLVALIARLYDPSEGAVLVDGADVREVDVDSLRTEIAFVADDSFLFTASVAENIAYAAPRGDPGGDRSGGPAGPGRRLHPRAARRLRHPGRRARPHPLRRPAPAGRDRPRPARRPADPDPRRRHLLGRRDHRGGDQVGPARGDGGPHDLHHRPPPLDRLAGRRDRRHRRRPRSSTAAPTRS